MIRSGDLHTVLELPIGVGRRYLDVSVTVPYSYHPYRKATDLTPVELPDVDITGVLIGDGVLDEPWDVYAVCADEGLIPHLEAEIHRQEARDGTD